VYLGETAELQLNCSSVLVTW